MTTTNLPLEAKMSTTSKTQFEGVRIRHYKTRDVLLLQFNDGKERREQINLPPTILNQRMAFGKLASIKDRIARGTFNYSEEFPNSKEATKTQLAVNALLVEAALKTYLADFKLSVDLGKKADSSYIRTVNVVNRLIVAFGHYSLAEITPAILRDWIKNRGVSAKTINNDLTPLREIYSQAFSVDEVIDSNPFNRLDVGKLKDNFCKASTHEIDPFTPDEVRDILRVAKDQSKNYVQFGFATGLRGGELIGLRWGDIDWDAKVVHVVHNRVGKKDKAPKTAAGKRDVPLSDDAIVALKAQKAWTFVMQDFVFNHDKTKVPFRDSKEVQKSMWQPLLAAAAVKYREPKQIRHTYASACLSRGDNVHKVAKQLGHTDATMVLRVYGKFIAQYEDEHLKVING
jgi:integrase